MTINNEISAAYKVDKKNNEQLYFTLCDVNQKNVFYNKKLLKGTDIVTKEDLSHYSFTSLRLVKERSVKYDFKNVRTIHGIVYVKTE